MCVWGCTGCIVVLCAPPAGAAMKDLPQFPSFWGWLSQQHIRVPTSDPSLAPAKSQAKQPRAPRVTVSNYGPTTVHGVVDRFFTRPEEYGKRGRRPKSESRGIECRRRIL